MLQSAEGLGYDDLNLLMKEPKPLTFIIELLSVSQVNLSQSICFGFCPRYLCNLMCL